MEFRRLLRDDDRTLFESGEPALDEFFRRYAGQNQFRHQIGVTYVLVEETGIAGYVTVAAHALQPEAVGYRLPIRASSRSSDCAARGRCAVSRAETWKATAA